jgi:hypothetical protein
MDNSLNVMTATIDVALIAYLPYTAASETTLTADITTITVDGTVITVDSTILVSALYKYSVTSPIELN